MCWRIWVCQPRQALTRVGVGGEEPDVKWEIPLHLMQIIPGASAVKTKNPPANAGASLGQEDSLEEEMATCSSILA